MRQIKHEGTEPRRIYFETKTPCLSASVFKIFLSNWFERQFCFLSITSSIEGSDEPPGLVRDAYFAIREPLLIKYLTGFGIQIAAALGTEEVDGRIDGERQAGMAIACRRKGQVCQRKDGTTLAHATSVQVFRLDFHPSLCIAVSYFQEFDARIHGKAVAF